MRGRTMMGIRTMMLIFDDLMMITANYVHRACTKSKKVLCFANASTDLHAVHVAGTALQWHWGSQVVVPDARLHGRRIPGAYDVMYNVHMMCMFECFFGCVYSDSW